MVHDEHCQSLDVPPQDCGEQEDLFPQPVVLLLAQDVCSDGSGDHLQVMEGFLRQEVETMGEKGEKERMVAEVIKSSLAAELDHSTQHVLRTLPRIVFVSVWTIYL